MTDPLSLLRLYNITKKEIIERDGQIIFGEFSWPKNVKTNYLIWGSSKKGSSTSTKDYYTLECLLNLLKNMSLIHTVYLRQALAKNIPAIKRPDRKELLKYLNGEIAKCPSIDETVSLEMPNQVKRPVDSNESEIFKKPKFAHSYARKVAVKLDEPKETSVTSFDNIKSLSEALSMEKIAAIKAKRLALKRTTVKENNGIHKYDKSAILDPDDDIIQNYFH